MAGSTGSTGPLGPPGLQGPAGAVGSSGTPGEKMEDDETTVVLSFVTNIGKYNFISVITFHTDYQFDMLS